jgi:hypothetical protein
MKKTKKEELVNMAGTGLNHFAHLFMDISTYRYEWITMTVEGK